MQRNTLIAAIAATLVSVAAVAAGPGGYGMGGRYGMGGGGMGGYCQEQGLNALGLTSEQRGAIAAIQSEFSGKQVDLMASMRELRTQGSANYAAMDDLRQQMFELRQQRFDRIEAVLTPEQRAQWRPGGARGAPWRG